MRFYTTASKKKMDRAGRRIRATAWVLAVATVAIAASVAFRPPLAQAAGFGSVAPTANQLRFSTAVGTTQFITFNVCTFNDCEQDDLGSNRTFPAASFAPTDRVDTDQWVRVAQSWGARQLCLTAHHSGGFALWQTNTTDYGLRESPYMDGKADIVLDFVASCRKFGVSPCLYFIPAMDTHEDHDTPAVRHLCASQSSASSVCLGIPHLFKPYCLFHDRVLPVSRFALPCRHHRALLQMLRTLIELIGIGLPRQAEGDASGAAHQVRTYIQGRLDRL